MKKILLLAVIVLGLYSCEYPNNSRPPGLLKMELSIGSQGCDTIITSQQDECFLDDNHITVDYKRIDFPVCDAVLSYTTPSQRPVRPGICSDSIMTVKYDIRSGNRVEIVQFESDYLNFTKETPKRMHFVVKPNLTGKIRHFKVSMVTLDASIMDFIYLDIIQSSE
jgi:hypothetical protein